MTTQPVPSPEDLVIPHSSRKYYTVTKGLSVGIFGEWYDVAEPLVTNVSDSCHKAYPTWKKALDAYTTAYKQGAVEIKQRTGTASLPNAKAAAHGVFPIPKPEELEPFDSEDYYVVIVGSRVGIFKHWNEAQHATSGVSNSIPKRFPSWPKALERYSEAYSRGKVEIIGRKP